MFSVRRCIAQRDHLVISSVTNVSLSYSGSYRFFAVRLRSSDARIINTVTRNTAASIYRGFPLHLPETQYCHYDAKYADAIGRKRVIDF